MVFVFRKFPLLFGVIFPLLSFIIVSISIAPVSEMMVKHLVCSLFSNRVLEKWTWNIYEINLDVIIEVLEL